MPKRSFTDLFVRKPVIALVVNIAILVVGLVSYNQLNTRQYPRSDSAVVNVSTIYFGASADTVRGYITTQLERAISSADGIDYIESESFAGMSTIRVYLRLNYDTNAALAQISAKIDQVRNELPPEAESPTISVETTDNQFASMYLSFYSDTLSQNQITDYLNRMVQPRLAAIKGVQKADILGGRVYAMRVWLKPDELAARGLSPSEVRQALVSNNALSAVGATKGNMLRVSLVANTDLKNVDEFRSMVVAQNNGAIVRLADVAEVELGAESYDAQVRFGGQTATFMGIWVLPTESTVEVIQRVRDAFPDVEASLPAGLNGKMAYDATEYINDALREILTTLLETLLIVMLVIFLFMGSLRSVFIPVVAMPLSLIGAMFVMFLMGFTINLLTLLAVVLAVGIVVDDAIVVVENVERHIREGLTPINAAIQGARELVGPVISMTITLASVYAPIGFQGGLTGALFREFAFTLAGAVAVSGFVALTLSPMMSAYMLKGGDAEEKGLTGIINRVFDRVRNRYERVVGGCLEAVPVILTLAVLFSLLLGPFFMFAQKELAPKEDQGVLMTILQGAPTATLEQAVMNTAEVQKIYEAQPEYETSFQITTPNFGFGGMILKPWSERERSVLEIEAALQSETAKIAGANAILNTPDALPAGGQFPIEFVIRSTDDHREMLDFANQLVLYANTEANAGGGAPTFYFADSDLKFDLPQTTIDIDKDMVASMGLNLTDVSRDLGSMLGGGYVNRFVNDGRSYRVIPQVERGERLNPEQLLNYHIRGPQGQLIPLSTIATLTDTVEPRGLNRFQQLNSVKITGVGPSIDSALTKLEQKAQEILPPGYTVDYGGQSRQLRLEGNALWQAGLLALVLIFLVLSAQFNSFRDPLIILLGSVPLALVGAMLPIFLWKTSLNIYSQIGLITLVGLIAKNGILIVEFANSLQEQGVPKKEAIRRAAATRLRPVLMTSAATVFGHMMLIFVDGPGAAARNSIGWVLVVGMAVGTFFTLFVVPAFYMLIASEHKTAIVDDAPDGAIEPVQS
ncbi:efflux RND transporter permease subunit [Synoicihabitans lomoniglobus]|uniref:Efflux RND transporter permease subunit n=1 Tax=Synoicihabitans lomoniglobus TaxID=2909285 RepID=A0AAF0CRK7_9BACT|nr:efflux RND transporter permease subunit [Opitutaceae bacterium LMO-M01]WED66681.1 efflux RND transporter permease subunit [Opitutaceae bacterium LMO-M01]